MGLREDSRSEGGDGEGPVGTQGWGERCGNLKASVRALAFALSDSREPFRALGREVMSSNSHVQTMTLAAECRTDQGSQGKTPPGGDCHGTQMVWTRQMSFHPGPQDSLKDCTRGVRHRRAEDVLKGSGLSNRTQRSWWRP